MVLRLTHLAQSGLHILALFPRNRPLRNPRPKFLPHLLRCRTVQRVLVLEDRQRERVLHVEPIIRGERLGDGVVETGEELLPIILGKGGRNAGWVDGTVDSEAPCSVSIVAEGVFDAVRCVKRPKELWGTQGLLQHRGLIE